MLKHLLISPERVTPLKTDMLIVGTFNPGATLVNDRLMLVVRVAVSPANVPDDHFADIRFVDGELKCTALPANDFDNQDSRVLRRRKDGLVTLSSLSYLQFVWIDDYRRPIEEWRLTWGDCFLPDNLYESFGVEDARCTWIEGCCFMTYTSVSPHGACTSLATTTDFKTFKRHGVIFPCENKDVVLFPDRIEGKIHALHRPVSATKFCAPEIWTASSEDGVFWGHHHVLATGNAPFEADRIGAGTPPIGSHNRYHMFYHASANADEKASVGTYTAAVMELVVAHGRVQLQRRATNPLMIPTEPWELTGFVPNVVFPTGAVELKDRWLVFYGAADTHVGVADISRNEIIESLE